MKWFSLKSQGLSGSDVDAAEVPGGVLVFTRIVLAERTSAGLAFVPGVTIAGSAEGNVLIPIVPAPVEAK